MRRRFIMKIGILGSGDVGRRLADGFIELGHTVKIGSRNPNQEKITEWIAKHNTEKVSSGTFAETASFGKLNVLITLWGGTADAIRMANPKLHYYLYYLCLSVEDLKKYGKTKNNMVKTKRRAQGIFIYTLCYWDLNIDM